MSLPILAHLIKEKAAELGDQPLLTFVDVGRDDSLQEETRSYQQLWDKGQKLAQWLRQHGLAKGDRFALMMANHPEFVDLMVASSILGTVFVPIDPRTRGDKLRYMLDFAQCKGVFASREALPEIAAVWPRAQWASTGSHDGQRDGQFVVALEPVDGLENMQAICAQSAASEDIAIVSSDPMAPMQVLYTSGTTGDPKAIVAEHSKLFVGGGLMKVLGLTPADKPYTGLSLTHANAQIISLGIMLCNALPGVISRRFTKSRLWDITRHYGCTIFNLLGGMTNAVYAEPVKPDDADNPVRIVLSAGMPDTIWRQFEQRFKLTVYEFYGAAEGGLSFNLAGMGPVGSCGKAPPHLQLAILDEAGQLCAPGSAGEICFRNADGSCPGLTYMDNPEATAKKLADGWLHMGDIGHLDENGWLFFHYRMGGGIRRNGDFINTAVVEKALMELDEVSDVYVYGVALPGMAPGEKEVVAAIVAHDRTSFDPARIFSACRAALDANAVPRFVHVVDEIPKTASEKPIERLLVEGFSLGAATIFTA